MMDTEDGWIKVAIRPVIQIKELTFKLILLGDSSVGKTSLLRRYANEETPTGLYKPTIGVDFRTKQLVIEDAHVRALIWDTAGQERFKTMTKQYYRGSHGVVLVYDVTNADSFHHVERWIGDFKKFADNSAQKILVGNKCDVGENEREVTLEQGQLLGLELGVPFMETSAKDNVNVTELAQLHRLTYLDSIWRMAPGNVTSSEQAAFHDRVFEKVTTDLVIRRQRRDSFLTSPSPSPSPRTSVVSGMNGTEVITLKLNDKPKLKKKIRCCYE